ncbi:MAG: SH3 domain-containing protein [Verrucomicrobia bacterium]|nr:SH3 domain-containing protein [Verrucomicrobiota bacterium]
MVRRVLVIGLAVCLAGLFSSCRDTGTQKTSTARRSSAARVPLMKRYDPRKQIQEWVRATKGEGEGEKVKVYAGPSTKELVIGQLNFGANVLLVDQVPGWYGVRYYNADGGEFYGWVRLDQMRYVGQRQQENEVIVVGDDQDTRPFTIEEADEAMRRVLSVPYKRVQGRDGQLEKAFWGGKDAEGYDDLSLLVRLNVTSDAKRWAAQAQVELSKLSRRTPQQYIQVLVAYWSALDWYVKDNKSQFTKMLRQADDKRNEFAQYFGN